MSVRVDHVSVFDKLYGAEAAAAELRGTLLRPRLFDLPPLRWPLGAGFGMHGARYRVELHPTTGEWVWWKAPDDARDGETIAEVMARHLAEAYRPELP